MKIIILLMLSFVVYCIPIKSYSQTYRYSFGYDACGNRISRDVIELRSANISLDSLQSPNIKAQENKIVEEAIDNKKVLIYPNPTKGYLTVDITLNETDSAIISIFDIHGRTLMNIKNAGTTTNVDLSGQPSGIYMMRILVNNKSTTWKIIKQD